MNKCILISIDGMRPDGFLACGNPYIKELMAMGSYTLTGRTVFPSITLPCHTSMFHSVPPQVHGILDNTYVAPEHPVDGIFEAVKNFGGRSVMFYNWQPLRDIGGPSSLIAADYISDKAAEFTDRTLTRRMLSCAGELHPEFIFMYMVETDTKGGHHNGWMSEEYLRRISLALDNVREIIDTLTPEYSVVITADHGGHDHNHGEDVPEDMTIPQFYIGPGFEPGRQLEDVSILDTAPTIADIMGIEPDPEWVGKSLLRK